MKIRKILLATLTVAGLGAFASSAASAVTVVNGSFETPGIPSAFATLSAGDMSIAGWTVGGGGVDYIGSYWTASNGRSSLDLNAEAPGSISQLLTGLTAGTTYSIKFDLAGNPAGDPSNKTLDVFVGGAVLPTYSTSFDATGHSLGNMGWTTKTFNFTAASSSELLNFVSTTTGNSGNGSYPYAFGPALDNVSISVPEPATWAMFLLGFGAIGWTLRSGRRQQRVAATA